MSFSILKKIGDEQKKKAVVDVRSGDTVKVTQRIKEGDKSRLQVFEGVVIRTDRKDSHTARITVRKVASGVGVEKSYLVHSPLVEKIMEAKTAGVAPAQVIPDAAEDASEDVKRTVTEAKTTAAAAHKADLEAFAGDNEILKQITDLALLANGMLKGKDLSDFIARSAKVVEDAYLK